MVRKYSLRPKKHSKAYFGVRLGISNRMHEKKTKVRHIVIKLFKTKKKKRLKGVQMKTPADDIIDEYI